MIGLGQKVCCELIDSGRESLSLRAGNHIKLDLRHFY